MISCDPLDCPGICRDFSPFVSSFINLGLSFGSFGYVFVNLISVLMIFSDFFYLSVYRSASFCCCSSARQYWVRELITMPKFSVFPCVKYQRQKPPESKVLGSFFMSKHTGLSVYATIHMHVALYNFKTTPKLFLKGKPHGSLTMKIFT